MPSFDMWRRNNTNACSAFLVWCENNHVRGSHAPTIDLPFFGPFSIRLFTWGSDDTGIYNRERSKRKKAFSNRHTSLGILDVISHE